MLTRIIATIAIAGLPMLASAGEYRTADYPRQECWNEQVPVQSQGSGLGPLIGGIAGGIIGNQVGGGSGRAAATAVGVVTGAVVGDRLSQNAPQYRTVQRCRTIGVVEQAPVYRQPPPAVIYAPQPVTVIEPPPPPVYYVQPATPYYGPGRWDNGWHRGWRHHHHDDDDDD